MAFTRGLSRFGNSEGEKMTVDRSTKQFMFRPRAAILFLCFFTVFLWTSAPAVSWFDTGELAVGAFTLGIGHPPGQPFYAQLGKGVTMLPLGSIPFRITLFSALCGAGLVALLPFLLEQIAGILGRTAPRPVTTWILLPGFGLALPLWLQTIRIEVYALNLLLAVLLISIALSRLEHRNVSPALALFFAFLTGLALADHPLLIVAAIPGLFVLLGIPGLKHLSWCVAMGILGLGTYLYLPLRSVAGAALNWGQPERWPDFLAVATARTYQRSFVHLTLERLVENLSLHAQLARSSLGLPILLLAVLGVATTFRRPRVALGILLIGVGNLATTATQAMFFPDNPDALGYLSLSFVLIGLMTALGFDFLLEVFARLGKRLSIGRATRLAMCTTIAIVLGVTPAIRAWPRPNLRDDWTCLRYGHALLRALPAGCLYLAGSDASTFASWYSMAVEGARPDLALVALYALPGQNPLRIGDTSIHPLPSSPDSPARIAEQLIERTTLHRPIRMTANDLPMHLYGRLRADVMTFEIIPADAEVPLDYRLPAIERYWQREKDRLLSEPAYIRDRQARLRIPSHADAVGDVLRNAGLLEPALRMYRLAEALDPDASRLVRLKRAKVQTLVEDLEAAAQAPATGLSEEEVRAERVARALTLGHAREAGELLADSVESSPVSLQARARLAYLEGRFPEMLRLLRQLKAEAPVGPAARSALEALEPLLPPEMAEDWLKQYLEHERPPALLTALGERQRNKGNYREASVLFDIALHVDPENVGTHVAMGWLYVDQGDLAAAFEAVQTALEVDPTDPKALQLSSFLHRSGLR